MAVAASSSFLLAIAGLYLVDAPGFRLPRSVLIGLLAYWLLVCFTFYALLRTNWNLRLADPSMTVPKMLAAIVGVSAVVYYAGPYQGLFAIFYLLALQFAQFRLGRGGFLLMALLCVTLYGLANAASWWRHEANTSPLPWMLSVAVVALVLLSFSLVGSYFSLLRRRLRSALEALREAHEENSRLAETDHLTQALNRRAVMRLLAREKQLADHEGNAFSIILIDVDRFKRINDTFGHLAGDRALVHVVRGLRQVLRDPDRLGRYGGEEFLAALPGADVTQGVAVAERLRQVMASSPVHFRNHTNVTLTVSVGVAEYQPGEALDQLIERTDHALYQAKAAGRNRVCAGDAAPLDDEDRAVRGE